MSRLSALALPRARGWTSALGLIVATSSCAGSRTIVIQTERPAAVRFNGGRLLCDESPCRFTFPNAACGGPFQSHSGFVGFSAVDRSEPSTTYQGDMLPLCELEDGQVVTIAMSGDARVTSATVEFIDSHVDAVVASAARISRGRVRTMRARSGKLELEIEILGAPLKGASSDKLVQRRMPFHHPGRLARGLPRVSSTRLSVGDEVLVFDAQWPNQATFAPTTHVENALDRGRLVREAIARESR